MPEPGLVFLLPLPLEEEALPLVRPPREADDDDDDDDLPEPFPVACPAIAAHPRSTLLEIRRVPGNNPGRHRHLHQPRRQSCVADSRSTGHVRAAHLPRLRLLTTTTSAATGSVAGEKLYQTIDRPSPKKRGFKPAGHYGSSGPSLPASTPAPPGLTTLTAVTVATKAPPPAATMQ